MCVMMLLSTRCSPSSPSSLKRILNFLEVAVRPVKNNHLPRFACSYVIMNQSWQECISLSSLGESLGKPREKRILSDTLTWHRHFVLHFVLPGTQMQWLDGSQPYCSHEHSGLHWRRWCRKVSGACADSAPRPPSGPCQSCAAVF